MKKLVISLCAVALVAGTSVLAATDNTTYTEKFIKKHTQKVVDKEKAATKKVTDAKAKREAQKKEIEKKRAEQLKKAQQQKEAAAKKRAETEKKIQAQREADKKKLQEKKDALNKLKSW